MAACEKSSSSRINKALLLGTGTSATTVNGVQKVRPTFPRLILGASALLLLLIGIVYVWWFQYYHPVSFLEVRSDRARLVDDLESYISVEELVQRLQKRAIRFELDATPSSSSQYAERPPFNVASVKVRNFTHLGVSGEFVVEFFNNRLVGARFYPADTDAYLAQLLSRAGIDLVHQSEVYFDKNARAWRAFDHAERGYVGWEDVRLSREMELWIRRYS